MHKTCGRGFRRGQETCAEQRGGWSPSPSETFEGEFCRTRCADLLKSGQSCRRKCLFCNRFNGDSFEDYDENKFVRQNSHPPLAWTNGEEQFVDFEFVPREFRMKSASLTLGPLLLLLTISFASAAAPKPLDLDAVSAGVSRHGKETGGRASSARSGDPYSPAHGA